MTRAGRNTSRERGLRRGSGQFMCQNRMAAGPRMTTNSTGRKKMIIGTVSFGGSAAAFFSASRHAHVAVFLGHHAQRLPNGRAVALGLDERRRHGLDAGEAGALAEVLERLAAIRQVGQLGGGQRQLFGEFQRLARRPPRRPCRTQPRPTCPTARRSAACRARPERPA